MQKGFTLIELLVVVSVVGLLGAGLLIVVDPLENIQRADDAGRKRSVEDLQKANEAYFVFRSAYVGQSETTDPFQQALGPTGTGDIKSTPKPKNCPTDGTSWTYSVTYSPSKAACGYKYDSPSGWYVIYTLLRSKAERKAAIDVYVRLGLDPNLCNNLIYWLYTSVNGKFGYFCHAGTVLPSVTDAAKY